MLKSFGGNHRRNARGEHSRGDGADIFIGAAAVVDFKPETVATQKIKRAGSRAWN